MLFDVAASVPVVSMLVIASANETATDTPVPVAPEIASAPVSCSARRMKAPVAAVGASADALVIDAFWSTQALPFHL